VPWGETLTRWTVRLALLLYAATVALRLAAPRHRGAARALWTLGCLLFLAHVAAAFQFAHGWSHARAYAETARQTRDLFGLEWGGGIHFNYLFTVLWVVDATYWWAAGLGAYERRPRWIEVSLHAFFAFMAFNGAVVFARGATRWVAVGITVGLVLLCLSRLRGRRRLRPRREPAGDEFADDWDFRPHE
jgi:hypothetical protein